MLRCTAPIMAKMNVELRQVSRADRKHFQLLGVLPSSSSEGVKTAYRKLARRFHPDMNNGDDSKMKEVNKAYAFVVAYIKTQRGASTEKKSASSDGAREKTREPGVMERIAKWLREDTEEDPSAVYRSYVDKVGEEKAAQETLGNEEEEQKWAESFWEAKMTHLGRKNQWRSRDRTANPFSDDPVERLPDRLEHLTLADPLYWGRPAVPPSPPRELLSGTSRPSPFLARRREALLQGFSRSGAERFARLERHVHREAVKTRAIRDSRKAESRERVAPDNVFSFSMPKLHEESWERLQMGKGASDTFDNPMRTRPRLGVRGQLIRFESTDGARNPTTVTMSRDAFESVGKAYIDR
eukprot:Sspe_Gene.107660::Locus_85966_Transcript_1_1_Confidence_1.000_Length_1163::g.107660::m.107660